MAPRRVVITGNTYPVKEELKLLGATYDGKAWKISASKAAEAQAIVLRGPKPKRKVDLTGTFRPGGYDDLCLGCGDDCGGNPWNCGYVGSLSEWQRHEAAESPGDAAKATPPRGPCAKCGSYCEGDCSAQ